MAAAGSLKTSNFLNIQKKVRCWWGGGGPGQGRANKACNKKVRRVTTTNTTLAARATVIIVRPAVSHQPGQMVAPLRKTSLSESPGFFWSAAAVQRWAGRGGFLGRHQHQKLLLIIRGSRAGKTTERAERKLLNLFHNKDVVSFF